MKLELENFMYRKLSLSQATAIAKSQEGDLGGKSVDKMIIALSGGKWEGSTLDEFNHRRMVAYLQLDELSKLIVETFLMQEEIRQASAHLRYQIYMLTQAHEAAEKIVDDER